MNWVKPPAGFAASLMPRADKFFVNENLQQTNTIKINRKLRVEVMQLSEYLL